MLEKRVHSQLYDALANNSWTYQNQPVLVQVLRARQVVENLQFPAIFIDYGDTVLDLANTPLNEVFRIYTITVADGEDIAYDKGVVVQQSINLNLYDNNIRRIAELQEQLFTLARQLSFDGVTVFRVNPPRVLDFTEEDYVYRRLVEVVCKFEVSLTEIVKTIEEVETSVEAQ